MRRNFLKAVSCVLAILMLCTSVFATSVSDFKDVPSGAWYIPELTYAVDNNMIQGTTETTFSPSGEMTRAQFITVIGRALKGTAASTGKFKDIDETQYYVPYLYWGVEKGIIQGTSATTFAPNSPITRQDMAAIVGRTIENLGLNISVVDTPVKAFNDMGAVAEYARASVELLRQKALLKGDTNGNVNPKQNMTRAEGTAVLSRMMMHRNAGTDITPEKNNALSMAREYIAVMAFSRDRLVDQLEYEGFSHEAAIYGADNCGANWNEQALTAAREYLDVSAFSYIGLVEQLEYDKFTAEQAEYGVSRCGANWNEQAALAAKEYLELFSFSREELISQLEYDGFTHDQAVYGAEQNGY